MLHYQLEGDQASRKAPLVLLHGLCENLHVWDKVVAEMKATFPIIRMDLPGFGKSISVKAESMEAMAEAVVRTLDELQVSKAVIVGHSMGGYVSLAIAERFSERLAGLGLFHSTALADNEERKEKRKKQLESIATYGKEPFLKDLHKGLFGKNYTNEKVKQEVWEMLYSAEEAGISNAIRVIMNRKDLTSVLQKAFVPVLMVAGRYDEIIPIASLSQQVLLPEVAIFEILENSGHMGMLEEEENSGKLLSTFYERCLL